MRRVIVTASHDVIIEQVEAPTPGPDEALVRMTYVGLCGSDRHALQGKHPFIELPYAPGHEVIGVIEAFGDAHHAAPTIGVGQRVVVEPTLPCWDCKQCRAGRENLCEQLRFFGCGDPQGGLAELFTIPVNRLHAVPDDLDDQQAILVEPLSTPVHATRLAGPLAGRSVAILGGGPIGLLVLALTKAQGASRVVLTDRHDHKLSRALALGADATVDGRRDDATERVRAELGQSADVVFDCVATQQSIDQAIALARKAGTVVVVGVAAGPVTVPLQLLQDQQIRIQGSATYLPADYRQSIRLLQSGAVQAQDFITGVYAFDQVADAFAALASGDQVKVVVTAES